MNKPGDQSNPSGPAGLPARWPAFDLTATPLAMGTTLIEASAGTGKTFTIAGLFLRLILERDFSVREILVVTFTEAATEELRDRIRRTLADAAAAFRAGGSSDDVMARLIAPHLPQSRQMLARLDRALCGFDEAPIFTIHGFCQRTLRDRAFESGALFDTELITDDSDLLQAITDDYWRTRFYEAGALPVGFALKNRLQPESFLPLLREQTRHPLLRYVSRVDGRELDELIGALEKTFAAARAVWLKEKDAIRALLDPDAGWAKKHTSCAISSADEASFSGPFAITASRTTLAPASPRPLVNQGVSI